MASEGLLTSNGGPPPPSASDAAAADPPRPVDVDFEHDPSVVLALLEPDQLVDAKAVHLGQRPMSRGLRALLWALRVYVLFMLVVVAIQVVRSLHSGGNGA